MVSLRAHKARDDVSSGRPFAFDHLCTLTAHPNLLISRFDVAQRVRGIRPAQDTYTRAVGVRKSLVRWTIQNMNRLCNRPTTLHTNKGHEIVDDMTITKIQVGAAIVFGACVVGAAPASAEENPVDQNPFAALGCSCQETPSPGSPAEELERGILGGIFAGPGLRSPS
jgi:hypothetical protein